MVRFLIPAAALLSSLAGCGGNTPATHAVSGTVTHDGKPVPNVVVVFAPEDESRVSYGHADQDGRFKMLYTNDVDGVKAGKHTVYLMPPSATPDDKPLSSAQQAMMKKYSEGNSPYEITVDEDLVDFELKLE